MTKSPAYHSNSGKGLDTSYVDGEGPCEYYAPLPKINVPAAANEQRIDPSQEAVQAR